MKNSLFLSALTVAAFAAPVALPTPAEARVTTAQCVIQSPDGTYNGPCRFQTSRGGSFSVDLPGGRPMLGSTVMLSVAVTSSGIGEARGLTTNGINSRWGRVVRMDRDRACWSGGDFTICAY